MAAGALPIAPARLRVDGGTLSAARMGARHGRSSTCHPMAAGSGTLASSFGQGFCLSGIGAQLCYEVRMNKRPGGTVHLSISLPADEAKVLKRRAKRVHGGNVSRVVSDAIRYIAYEEGRDALIASFGGKGKPTPAEAARLDEAWGIISTKSA
jgi:hypothetical protein